MPLLDHFSLLAPIYDRVFKPPSTDVLRRLLALPTEGVLLDVGGGTGRLSQFLAEGNGDTAVVDEAPGMLRQARGKGLGVIQARAEEMPFAEGSVDRILVVDAIHHVADAPAVLGELRRALAPKGRLVIEELDIRRLRVKLVYWAERLLMMRSHFYTAEKLGGMLESLGMRVELERSGYIFWLVATHDDEQACYPRSRMTK